jgi:hypothetical protein
MAPAPRADALRKCRLLVMELIRERFAVNEGIGGQKRYDDRVETTIIFEVGIFGIDESFGV